MEIAHEYYRFSGDSAVTLGETIRFHRRRSGLSQRGLADLAQIGKTSVFDIEKGKPTVRLATIMAVLRVLNIQLVWPSPLMEEFTAQAVTSRERSLRASIE